MIHFDRGPHSRNRYINPVFRNKQKAEILEIIKERETEIKYESDLALLHSLNLDYYSGIDVDTEVERLRIEVENGY